MSEEKVKQTEEQKSTLTEDAAAKAQKTTEEVVTSEAKSVSEENTEEAKDAAIASEEVLETTIFEEEDEAVAEGDDVAKIVDRVVHISRVAKVVKGGRRFSFSALVVCGDGNGQVGFGMGKANEVPDAIRKGSEKARRSMISIPMIERTIPHDIIGEFGAGRVLLKKASPGTGVIAGGPVRAVFESAGVHDILTKCIGTSNPHNAIRAAFNGIQRLQHPDFKRGILSDLGE